MEAGWTEGDRRHTPVRSSCRLQGVSTLLPLLVIAVITCAQVCNANWSGKAKGQGDYCTPLPLPTCQAHGDEPPCTNNACCCQRQLHSCWQLQQSAQESLDVRDEFLHANRRGHGQARRRPSPAQTRAICLSQRTFNVCIARLSRVCYGKIEFHTAQTGTERTMRRFNCAPRGSVFNCTAVPPVSPRSKCSFAQPAAGVRQYSFCALFGDPHLRTLDGRQQTCRVLGAWPLVDNKFFTVQVTNEHVATLHGSRVTAISKLTVVIKKAGHCSAHTFMTYQASSDWLPVTFDDGRTHFGAGESVSLKKFHQNRHVELYMRHANTTIIMRRSTSGQLSVALRMPDSLMNTSMAGIQLCYNGCPQGEIIEQRVIGEDDVTKRAMKTCRDAGTVDFHFDSCVFDMVVTGDNNYTVMAAHAQADTLRLLPQAAATLQNRTTLTTSYRTHKSASSHFTRTTSLLITITITWLIAWWPCS